MVLRRGHGNYWMQQLRARPGLPQHSTGQKSLVFPSFILRLSSAFPGGILYTLLPRKPASAFMAESCLSLFVPLRRFSQSIDFLRLHSLEILATTFDDGPDEWQMAVLTGLIFIDSVSIGAMNVSASFILWNSVDRVCVLVWLQALQYQANKLCPEKRVHRGCSVAFLLYFLSHCSSGHSLSRAQGTSAWTANVPPTPMPGNCNTE